MNKTIKSCYGACDDCNESETCDSAPKRKENKTVTNLLEYKHEIPPWKLCNSLELSAKYKAKGYVP